MPGKMDRAANENLFDAARRCVECDGPPLQPGRMQACISGTGRHAACAPAGPAQAGGAAA